MKTIYLIRHAKSSWKEEGMRDFDRPLNNRGLSDAPMMGERMVARNQLPDLIISSEANRALTTARFIAEKLPKDSFEFHVTKELYHASPSTILNIINGIDDKFESVAIVCHNPGISQFNYELTGQPMDMVTCAISHIELDVESWQEVFPGTGTLKHFDYPKKLD